MNKKLRISLIAILGCTLIGLVTLLVIKIPKGVEAKEVVAEVVEPEKDELIITMVGDNLIHSPIYQAAKTPNGYNFDMIFENMKDEIESSDLAIINQETIFIADESKYSSYPRFGTPTDMGHSLVNAGFDIIACATNHTNDKGTEGITDTLNFWKENYPDIKILGIHENEDDSKIVYVEKNNIKIAFVNYTFSLNGLNLPSNKSYMVDMLGNKEKIAEVLKEAKENSDILIPILHLGTEYVYKPSNYHKNYVDFFIDNGADIVLCAHPHVLEPYGMVTTEDGNTALVYYSLGNFVSHQNELPRMLGGMAKFKLVKEDGEVKIDYYELIPTVTHYDGKYYTVYKLEDYTNELAKKHDLPNVTVEKLKELYNRIMSE
ncbi:MAG: CapA family protein [Clostridia bacterium]|nr:CapA family protein [Clostridia bacterium]